jgi:hypothetical protein
VSDLRCALPTFFQALVYHTSCLSPSPLNPTVSKGSRGSLVLCLAPYCVALVYGPSYTAPLQDSPSRLVCIVSAELLLLLLLPHPLHLSTFIEVDLHPRWALQSVC